MSRSTLLSVTEIQARPLKQTSQMQKVGVYGGAPGSSQSRHPVGCSWAAPGWFLPPSGIGGPGSTRTGETQALKGHPCLCKRRGVGGPCGVSNLLNIVCDTRYQAEKHAAKSTAGRANK